MRESRKLVWRILFKILWLIISCHAFFSLACVASKGRVSPLCLSQAGDTLVWWRISNEKDLSLTWTVGISETDILPLLGKGTINGSDPCLGHPIIHRGPSLGLQRPRASSDRKEVRLPSYGFSSFRFSQDFYVVPLPLVTPVQKYLSTYLPQPMSSLSMTSLLLLLTQAQVKIASKWLKFLTYSGSSPLARRLPYRPSLKGPTTRPGTTSSSDIIKS